jgi:hypothetical protein
MGSAHCLTRLSAAFAIGLSHVVFPDGVVGAEPMVVHPGPPPLLLLLLTPGINQQNHQLAVGINLLKELSRVAILLLQVSYETMKHLCNKQLR